MSSAVRCARVQLIACSASSLKSRDDSVQASLFVMIAFDDGQSSCAHDLDAFMRIGVVADEIAEANEVRALLFVRVGEDGFGRLEIGVEIAEDGEAHVRRMGAN